MVRTVLVISLALAALAASVPATADHAEGHWANETSSPPRDPEIVVYTFNVPGWRGGQATFRDEPGDRTCYVEIRANTGGYNGTHYYSLAAHEFGHCLGLGHTSGEDGHPTVDLLSTELDYARPRCPSSLDVATLEHTFGTDEASKPPITQPVERYRQTDCQDRTEGPIYDPVDGEPTATLAEPATAPANGTTGADEGADPAGVPGPGALMAVFVGAGAALGSARST